MKLQKLLIPGLIAATVLTFVGYRFIDNLRTDSTAPVISIAEGIPEVSVQDEAALLEGITAADDTDGDVTGSLLVESITMNDTSGLATVHYAAFDRAGNVSKASRQVRYTDYESPRFALSSALAFASGSSFDVLNIITAQDVLDGNITHRIRATSLDDVSISSLGTHDVEFRVTNSLGETVRLTLPVEVYAAGSHSAAVQLSDYLIYLPVGSSFDAEDYLVSFSRGSTDVDLTDGMPDGYSLTLSGDVDTHTPGVYSIGYTVSFTTENYGGEDTVYSGYTKLIVVVEG